MLYIGTSSILCVKADSSDRQHESHSGCLAEYLLKNGGKGDNLILLQIHKQFIIV